MCIQVWSADAGVAHSPPSDLLWKSQASWGIGNEILTTLINADGEVNTFVFMGMFYIWCALHCNHMFLKVVCYA